MDAEKNTLVKMICASLHENAECTIPAANWDGVFNAAKKQAVAALAAKSLPAEVPTEKRTRWEHAVYAQTVKFVQYLHVQSELCGLFREKKIPMAIIKGAAAAMYYPEPQLRTMGDIDFVVPADKLEQARKFLEEAGYRLKSESGGRHIEFLKDGFSFEMHYHFSYADLNIESYIRDGLNAPETESIDSIEFPVLPSLTNGLILLAHLREHLRCGLGVRQVLDWMMYVERELPDKTWEEDFCPVAREKKMDVLAVTITRMCQLYLGLPETVTWCAQADEALCAQLMESIMSAENFGRSNRSRYRISGVTANIRREGFFPYLQRIGVRDWKLLNKYSWLRPFAWLRELLVFLRMIIRLKLRKENVAADIIWSSDQHAMLKKLQII